MKPCRGNICRCGTLPEDPAGHQTRRGGESMTGIIPVSRRGFLGRIFSAGALVVAAPLMPAEATPAAQRPERRRGGPAFTWA